MGRVKCLFFFFIITCSVLLTGCPFQSKESSPDSDKAGRLVMFLGVDISGSFKAGPHFKDSLRFMSYYLYAHLNGIGGAEVPYALFVGSIGGEKPNEPKTFYPIHDFKYKSIKEIEATLFKIFPKSRNNPFTDYNAFFRQVQETVRARKLLMKPISIILLSDGIPDAPRKNDYRSIELKPLENLTRNVTIRLLYTTAQVGLNWRTKVPRRRVRIWTQDANVMKNWNNPKILQPSIPFKKQTRFFDWLKDNVDFPARVSRVN